MLATENKKLMQHIFAELSKGNSQPFVENMADDFSWTITGTTQWSKKYVGKRAVIEELSGVFRPTLVPPILVEAVRYIADGTYVPFESRANNTQTTTCPNQHTNT